MTDPNADLANILAWALVVAVGALVAFRFRDRLE